MGARAKPARPPWSASQANALDGRTSKARAPSLVGVASERVRRAHEQSPRPPPWSASQANALGREAGEQEREAEIGGEPEPRERRQAEPGRPLGDRPEDGEREQALAPEALHRARQEQERDHGRRERRPRAVAGVEPPEDEQEREDEGGARAVDERLEALGRGEQERHRARVGDDRRRPEAELPPSDRDRGRCADREQPNHEAVPLEQSAEVVEPVAEARRSLPAPELL